MEEAQIQIVNNHIYNIGQHIYRESIFIEDSIGVTLRHNLLHDLPKSGVASFKVNNCTYEYNEIHNIALKEADNGTFYNYGGWTTYGNVWRYNFTHHNNRSNGFYSDDGDSGDVYYRNIVQGCTAGIKFGGGHDNIAYQNIFIENQTQEIDDRGIARNYKLGTPYETRLKEFKPNEEPWLSYGKNLKEKFGFSSNLWSEVLTQEYQPEHPNGSGMFDNIGVASGSFKKPKNGKVRVENNAILKSVEEAKFANYAQMDLRSTSSEILKVFPDLNEQFPKMGLQKDAYRLVVPTRAEFGGLSNRGQAGASWNEDQMLGN